MWGVLFNNSDQIFYKVKSAFKLYIDWAPTFIHQFSFANQPVVYRDCQIIDASKGAKITPKIAIIAVPTLIVMFLLAKQAHYNLRVPHFKLRRSPNSILAVVLLQRVYKLSFITPIYPEKVTSTLRT